MIVYTCITNSKDHLQPVKPYDGVQYICFSDKKFIHPVWEFRPIELLGQTDARRIARRYKILSHIYFPGEVTLWMDGRVSTNISPLNILDKYKSDIAIRMHHSRDCIYDEGEVIKRQNYDSAIIVNKQLERYRSQGFKANAGLQETGCILRRPTKQVELFNSLWWAEVSTGSKRDQLSCPYVFSKHFFSFSEMDRDDVNVVAHRRKTDVRY